MALTMAAAAPVPAPEEGGGMDAKVVTGSSKGVPRASALQDSAQKIVKVPVGACPSWLPPVDRSQGGTSRTTPAPPRPCPGLARLPPARGSTCKTTLRRLGLRRSCSHRRCCRQVADQLQIHAAPRTQGPPAPARHAARDSERRHAAAALPSATRHHPAPLSRGGISVLPSGRDREHPDAPRL